MTDHTAIDRGVALVGEYKKRLRHREPHPEMEICVSQSEMKIIVAALEAAGEMVKKKKLLEFPEWKDLSPSDQWTVCNLQRRYELTAYDQLQEAKKLYEGILVILYRSFPEIPTIVALTAAGEMVGEKHIGTYRHKKRGSTYDIVGGAFLQTDEPLQDMQALIIYQDRGGQLWARPKHEFEDGRFEYIADAPAPASPDVDVVKALKGLLTYEKETAKLKGFTDCTCMGRSRASERAYENGKCPHQLARAAIAAIGRT